MLMIALASFLAGFVLWILGNPGLPWLSHALMASSLLISLSTWMESRRAEIHRRLSPPD